jgi:hypothetical protein
MDLNDDRVLEWYDSLLEICAPTPVDTPPSPTAVLGHPAVATPTTRTPAPKRYLDLERNRIFKYCGVPTPWEGRTDDDLPPFFKGMVEYRSKKASDARFYVEAFAEELVEGHGRYCFVHSAQLVNDLRYLSLDGGDKTYAYESRSRGFSLFAFAPYQDVASSIRLRDEFIAHETADQHYVGDKRDLAALNQLHAEWPGDREMTFRWVDHYAANVKRFLGFECPLVESLERILHALNDPAQFTDWDMRDYWCVVWMLHKATRRFFMSPRTADIVMVDEVARHLESTLPYNRQVLPREMREEKPTPVSAGGEIAKKGKTVAHRAPFSSTFRHEIDKAKAAGKRSPDGAFRINHLLAHDPDGLMLLGADFAKVVAGPKKPCIRFIVGGECRNGAACHCSHELVGSPTKSMLDGIRERLKAAVAAYIKSLPDPKE